MTKREIEDMARKALSELPNHRVEDVLLRATGRPIVAWSSLTVDELSKVYAYSRSISLVEGTSP